MSMQYSDSAMWQVRVVLGGMLWPTQYFETGEGAYTHFGLDVVKLKVRAKPLL